MLRSVRRRRRGAVVLFTACGAAGLLAPVSQATTFVWKSGFSGDASGSWAVPANWGGTVASGSDNIADFSTINITAASTVTLDGDQSIGFLKFGDITAPIVGWNLTPGTGGSLTMTVSAGVPTITVVPTTPQVVTISATLAGNQGLLKNGGGTLVLSGTNTYSGTTGVSAGILQINNANAISGDPVIVNSAGGPNGAALTFGAGFNFTNNVSLGGAANGGGTLFTSSAGSNVVSGNVTLLAGNNGVRIGTNPGAGALLVSGVISGGTSTENLQIRSQGGDTIFAAANTYTNTTNVIQGTLQIAGGDNRLPINTALKMGFSSLTTSRSTFDLNGFNQQLLGLDYETAVVSKTNEVVTNLSATPSTLTLSGNATYTYGGVIQGNLQLVKSGTNRQILNGTSGPNTYTGATVVNNGILQFNGASNLGGTGTSLTVNSPGIAAAGFAMDQAFLNRVTATSTGGVALVTASGNALDFSAIPSVSLGAVGAVTYSGTITAGSRGYRLGGGGGTLTVSAVNALSGTNSLTVLSNGNVVLTAANSYGGTTLISTGTLTLQNDGTGQSTASNTAAIAMGSSAVLKLTGGITVNAPINNSTIQSVSGNNVLTGAIQNLPTAAQAFQSDAGKLSVLGLVTADIESLAGGRSPHSVNINGNGDGEFLGGIANAFSIQKNGTGTWTIGGTNTIAGTGGLKANNGTLLVNGTVTIATGGVTADATAKAATLGGGVGTNAGTIAGPVTLTAGTLSPGANGSNATNASVGVLNVASLNFNGGSNGTFLADIVGSAAAGPGVSYDQISYLSPTAAGITGGTATNAVRLVLDDAAYTPVLNDVFYLLHGGNNANTVVFASPNDGSALLEGSTFTGSQGQTYAIHYNDTTDPLGGNDVSLTVVNTVPEPAALGIIATTLVGLGSRRRRRRA